MSYHLLKILEIHTSTDTIISLDSPYSCPQGPTNYQMNLLLTTPPSHLVPIVLFNSPINNSYDFKAIKTQKNLLNHIVRMMCSSVSFKCDLMV